MMAWPIGSESAEMTKTGDGSSSPVESSTPQTIEYPRVFKGPHRKVLGFPLGGVGAGSISLGGRGELKEWWIFNRPDKGKSPRHAFPAIWVQSGSGKPVIRILEARFMPPFGRGPTDLSWENAPGLPRLESCTFTGEYPMARIDFEDSEGPIGVKLTVCRPLPRGRR